GVFVAWAQYNPSSKIRLRLLSWREGDYPDRDWYAARLAAALSARQGFQNADTTAVRLVFSEADGLPGLIVDRLANVLVAQLQTAGADGVRDMIVELLLELARRFIPTPFRLAAIVERSDGDGRRLEGLSPSRGPLYTARDDEPNLERVTIREFGRSFQVD